MAGIRAGTGSHPISDGRVSREEVAAEKVKSSKKRYSRNVDKGGEGKLSKKPLELDGFQLSRNVWGPPEHEREPPRGVVLGLPLASAADVGVRSAIRRPNPAGSARKGRVVMVKEEEVKGRELVVAEEGEVSWKEDFPVMAGCLQVECGDYVGEGGVQALDEWMGNVGKGEMNEWEEKWTELKKEEMQLFLRWKDLISELVKFVVDGIKSSK